mgnify:CR=1 FL=1
MRKTVIKFILGGCALYIGASLAYDSIYKEEIKQKNEEASAAKIMSRSLKDQLPTKTWMDSLKKQNSSIYILRTCDSGKVNLMGRFVHVDDSVDPLEIEQSTDAFAFGKKSWLELLVDVENSSYSQYELNVEDKGASVLKYSADDELSPGEVLEYSLDNLNQVVGSRFTSNFCVKNYVKNEFPAKSSYFDKLTVLFKSANIVLNKDDKKQDNEAVMGENTHVFKSKEEALNFLAVVKSFVPEAEQSYRRYNSVEGPNNIKSTQQVISFGFVKDNISLEVVERTNEAGVSVYSVRAVEV